MTTWNPSDKGYGITLSNGNLTAAGSGGVYSAVRGVQSHNAGKKVFEVAQTAVGLNSSTSGLANAAMSLSNYVGASGLSVCFQPNNHTIISGGITLVNAPNVTFASGDVMSFLVDFSAGKAWIAKNGTIPNSGDPATGANPWITFTSGTTLFPAYASPDSENSGTLNVSGPFSVAVPGEYEAWAVVEEPEIPEYPEGGHNECLLANVGISVLPFPIAPGGVLTLESCTPIMQLNHPAAKKVYYTGDVHWRIPLSEDGLSCSSYPFQQLVLELDETQHPADKLFDIFVVLHEGVPLLCTGPEWPSNTALPPWANGLTDGIETNKTAITLWNDVEGAISAAIGTATFVGTIHTRLAGRVAWEPHPTPVSKAPGQVGYFLGLWNAYNRRRIVAACADATQEVTGYASWSYNSFAPRLANDNPNNRIWWVDGRGKSTLLGRYDSSISYEGATNTGATVSCALDWQPGDYGRNYPHQVGQAAFIDHNTGIPLPSWSAPPPQIGLHNIAGVEYATNQVIKFEGTQFKDPNHPQPWPDMQPPGSYLSFSTLSIEIEM